MRAGLRGRVLILLAIAVALVAASVLTYRRVRAEAESEQRWSLVRARGGLRVGIDPSDKRFSYFTVEGWQGFDADLAREIARRLGLALWVEPVGYDGLYDALRSDRVDVSMSALIADPAQTADYAFSVPYFDAGLVLVGGCRPNEAIPGCLSSKRLSVALGSDADRLARQWERRAPNLVRIVFDEDRAALAALNTQSDAALVDGREVWQELDALRGSNQAIVLVEARPYVLAARRSDGRLLAEINAILNAMLADGSLDGLSRKWLAPR
ncbi:MAG TPA: ABC transporter substrate-binding protein [Thermoflexales bacterium]|nr:ABC transporter substrate-binding protein [Thermoflexales bacterium]